MRIFKIGPGGAPGAAGAPGKKKRQCTIFKLNYNSLYYLFQVLLAHLVQQADADEEKHSKSGTYIFSQLFDVLPLSLSCPLTVWKFNTFWKNLEKLYQAIFLRHSTFAQNNYNANFLSLVYFCRIVIIQ